jgi:hypothetical protein
MNKHTNKYINKQNRAEGAKARDSWPTPVHEPLGSIPTIGG